MQTSERIGVLPPYLFVEIDRKKKELISSGADVISFGVGDPDLPTPAHIVSAMQNAVANPKFHQYPFGSGTKEFRATVAQWYHNRFKVTLYPETEIIALLGSKEGIGHLPIAILNPGDVTLVPEPGYPVYNSGTVLADGITYFMPLLEKNGFLPDLSIIPPEVLSRTKLMYLNYPNNPTGATATIDFFTQVVEIAQKHQIIVAHDAAYTELYTGSNPPVSFLSIPGAKEVGIEFHSLSKTYNMTGWRIGWVCGNPEIISALAKVKDNYDSGVFTAIQSAGITALTGPQECVSELRKIYADRRKILVEGLTKLGWQVCKTDATFYVWTRIPDKFTSTQYANMLLTQAHIVCTPGVGFGDSGEGYLRFALTVPKERIKQAIDRIGRM